MELQFLMYRLVKVLALNRYPFILFCGENHASDDFGKRPDVYFLHSRKQKYVGNPPRPPGELRLFTELIETVHRVNEIEKHTPLLVHPLECCLQRWPTTNKCLRDKQCKTRWIFRFT